MSNIIITIPSSKLTRVVDGICGNFNYQETIANPSYDPEEPESQETISNPETKAQFAKRMVIKYVKDCVKAHEGRVAVQSAKDTIDADVSDIDVS